MAPNVLAAAVMLAIAFVLGVIVLLTNARQKKLTRQLDLVTLTPRAPIQDNPQLPRVRRLREGPNWSRGLVYLLFRYNPDAPTAWPVSRAVIAGIVMAIAAMVLGHLVLPWWLAVLDGAISGTLTVRGLLAWQQGRYTDRLMRQLPDTVELVVSAVRAGLPVAEAFRAVAREMPNPTGQQFGYVVNDLALGRPPEDALLNLYQRTRVAEYSIFAVTLAVQSRAGGGLAETIQIMGDTVRQRIALAGRAKALAGEAKLSARVLAALPFVAGAALSFERPGYLDPLFYEPRGQKLLVFGIISLILGVVTMRRMIKKGTTV